MSEQTIPDTARASIHIYERLKAQTNLEVYEGEASLQATLPLISYNLTPRPDLRHKFGTAMSVYRADVKVVFKGSTTTVDEHLLAIGRALDSAAANGVASVRYSPFIGPSARIAGEEEATKQHGFTYELRCG